MAKIPDHISKEAAAGAAEEIGRVVGIAGGYAKVEVVRGENCASCAIASSCPSLVKGGKVWTVSAKAIDNLVIGDTVRLAVAPTRFVFAAFLLFIFPVFFLLAAYYIAKAFGASDQWAMLYGISFAFAAYFIVRAYDKAQGRDNFYEIVEIIDKNNDEV